MFILGFVGRVVAVVGFVAETTKLQPKYLFYFRQVKTFRIDSCTFVTVNVKIFKRCCFSV